MSNVHVLNGTSRTPLSVPGLIPQFVLCAKPGILSCVARDEAKPKPMAKIQVCKKSPASEDTHHVRDLRRYLYSYTTGNMSRMALDTVRISDIDLELHGTVIMTNDIHMYSLMEYPLHKNIGVIVVRERDMYDNSRYSGSLIEPFVRSQWIFSGSLHDVI